LARALARVENANGHKAKWRILALDNSFHGRTFGSLATTGQAKYRHPFAPLLPGVSFVAFNDVEDLKRQFDGSVCAVCMETIQGEGGIYPVSEAFWNRARELASANRAALIADEIQCGLGRTGRAFAYQKFGSLPDIAAVAKPLAAGLPLGAVIANDEFAGALSPGLHGTTFGGGPLICATALEALRIIEDEKLMKNARERGAEIRAGLEKMAREFDFIREVRGEGLLIGLDLSVEGAPFVEAALKRGLVINCTHEHILRFLPPFIVRTAHVKEFLARLKQVFAKTPRPKAVDVSASVTANSSAAKLATASAAAATLSQAELPLEAR
jgi:acetylornithine aminotransferase/acetylornithine/N-succinyldiaminopimelate aminotransferase